LFRCPELRAGAAETWPLERRVSIVALRYQLGRPPRMEGEKEKGYRSPQRKLVKFFERSRDRGKAKSRVAKTVLKRQGTRLRRLERSNVDSQHQLAALQTQVAEWRAKPEEAEQELRALKKKYPPLSEKS
jgi:hypothetical protein